MTPSAMVSMNEGRFTLREGGVWDGDVFPWAAGMLNLEVRIEAGAIVRGDIYGKVISIGAGATVTGHLAASGSIEISNGVKIGGNVICPGVVIIGDAVALGDEMGSANVIGKDVKMGSGVEVVGNVLGVSYVRIGSNCRLHEVICTSGEVDIGNDNCMRDVTSLGRIAMGQGNQVSDHVIFSLSHIMTGPLQMAGARPGAQHVRMVEGKELNLNGDRVAPIDKAENTGNEETFRHVADMIRGAIPIDNQ